LWWSLWVEGIWPAIACWGDGGSSFSLPASSVGVGVMGTWRQFDKAVFEWAKAKLRSQTDFVITSLLRWQRYCNFFWGKARSNNRCLRSEMLRVCWLQSTKYCDKCWKNFVQTLVINWSVI
jgi:hypothetical protein